MQRRSPAGSRIVPLREGATAAEAAQARDPGTSGYLLLEVAVTLAVMGMVMAMALPGFGNGTTPTRLHALVVASASLLREARTAAVAHNSSVSATFDAPHRSLRAGTQKLLIPPDVDFTVLAGGNCPADGARTEILFRADGTNCGGVLRFAKGRRIFRARVNWVDGRIDVVEGQ